MPRINLRPWREEERKRRQREFGVAVAGAFVAGIAVVMLTMFAYGQMISAQQSRNERLRAEIAELEKSGSRVELRGVAQSSTRVSALMRQIDSSEWLTDPEVERVETTSAGASRQAEFIVYVRQVRGDGDEANMEREEAE